MSIQSINADQLTLSAFNIGVTQPTGVIPSISQSQSGVQGSDNDGSTGQASSVHVSKQAQLISKLQQLQQQDPAKFKQVLTDVANKLNAAAQSSTGKDQQFLSNLASKFQSAATTGDLSSLQPPARSTTPNATTNNALSLYAGNGQAATSLQSALSSAQSGSSTGSGSGGHHHHHGGGSGSQPSSATQQALTSVFKELNDAFASASTSSSTSTGTASVTDSQ